MLCRFCYLATEKGQREGREGKKKGGRRQKKGRKGGREGGEKEVRGEKGSSYRVNLKSMHRSIVSFYFTS